MYTVKLPVINFQILVDTCKHPTSSFIQFQSINNSKSDLTLPCKQPNTNWGRGQGKAEAMGTGGSPAWNCATEMGTLEWSYGCRGDSADKELHACSLMTRCFPNFSVSHFLSGSRPAGSTRFVSGYSEKDTVVRSMSYLGQWRFITQLVTKESIIVSDWCAI